MGRITYQNHTAAPDVHLPPRVQGVAHYEFGCRVAGAAAAGLHQIALSRSVGLYLVQPHALDKLAVGQVQLLVLTQLLARVERVGEPEIRDNNVAVAVEEQVFQLEIAMHDALLVQIAHAGNELGKQPPGRVVLEIAVVEDVVEELASRGVLEHDAVVPV